MPVRPLQRVCYVEDDEDIRKIVRMTLERIGKLTVEVVGDPLVAIEAIKAFKPELVMLDWMMPGMDGPTLYRRMREVPEVRDIPVVFITAKASEKELNELRMLGAAGTISKPVSPKDLPGQLRSIWESLP
jgi:CheY-like chemotaxis protein